MALQTGTATRAGITNDERMKDAIDLVVAKCNTKGRWAREAPWPSTTYSSFGRIGADDKWVTLNALLVLKKTWQKSSSIIVRIRRETPQRSRRG